MGAAPIRFNEENKLSYFVRIVDEAGKERLYQGKDLPREPEAVG
jgi:hypothetical protein